MTTRVPLESLLLAALTAYMVGIGVGLAIGGAR
jgi:hypothetical protein